ncbi:MAG: 50S ribosomal protein L10 [Clostridiales bacterium]|nr:50S ribosomal protein L10 [Clostridiales bacterium]
MPSAKILESKKAVVASLSEKIKASTAGVLVTYSGISVEDDTKMRAALRGAGVEYKVYKNSIIDRACIDAGYQFSDQLVGMTALAISESDPVAPAKILSEYAEKIETFSIKGGFMDGAAISVDEVNAIAKVPSKETMVCKIMGSMRSPLFNLAYVLQAIIDKNAEGADAPEAPAADAE